MADTSISVIDDLVARAASDADLRGRLIDDPRGTIKAETGMTVPADWNVVAHATGDGVELGFANDELPDAYLDLVAGGNLGNDPNSICGG